MKYISLNWTLALKFSIGKKKRMRDCRILMARDCKYNDSKRWSKRYMYLFGLKNKLPAKDVIVR